MNAAIAVTMIAAMMASITGLRTMWRRIAKLVPSGNRSILEEQDSPSDSLVVGIVEYVGGNGELLGIRCSNPERYFRREDGESEEELKARAVAEAESWSGLVVLHEHRC